MVIACRATLNTAQTPVEEDSHKKTQQKERTPHDLHTAASRNYTLLSTITSVYFDRIKIHHQQQQQFVLPVLQCV